MSTLREQSACEKHAKTPAFTPLWVFQGILFAHTRVYVGVSRVYLRMHAFLYFHVSAARQGILYNKLHHLTTETSKINMEHGGHNSGGGAEVMVGGRGDFNQGL